MQGFTIPKPSELFKTGGGSAAVEARVRQLESMIAALQTQPLKPTNTIPSTQSFLNILEQKQVQPNVASPNFKLGFAPKPSISAASPAGVSVPLSQPLGDASGLPPLVLTPQMSLSERKAALAPYIQRYSKQAGVDSALVTALIQQESGFNPAAQSSSGALGLMQLLPSTAQGLGVANPLDPLDNLRGGVTYLKQQLSKFNGNVPLALAAYNAGPGAVSQYQGIPPYPETQAYVRSILQSYLGSRNQRPA